MKHILSRRLALVVALVPSVASADKDLTKNGTYDCKKTPSLHIGNGEGRYVIKGKCKSISVDGGENRLTIVSVEKLTVDGAENDIVVDNVGAIDVGGSDNKIVWKKALSGDAPAITGQPDKNQVVQLGGAGTTSATTGGDKTAPGPAGTTVDCTKSPTFSYNDNGGTFTFTGKCDKIAIAGNDAHLTIESVKTLAISGNNTTATITAADTIATPGNNNHVTYKKAATANAKVKVSNPGNNNSVKLVK